MRLSEATRLGSMLRPQAHDEHVKKLLKGDEFVDEVNTLDGKLGGRADVVPLRG